MARSEAESKQMRRSNEKEKEQLFQGKLTQEKKKTDNSSKKGMECKGQTGGDDKP